jgi:hypothetical protein
MSRTRAHTGLFPVAVTLVKPELTETEVVAEAVPQASELMVKV